MITYDKPFKTIDEQLEILKSRGLTISSPSMAKHLLLTYSYYDLINGYKDVFMPNDKFVPGTVLEDLFAFAYIDKSIQALTMKYGLMAEVKFKTHLAYVLSKNIGVHENDYLNPKYYKAKINKNLSFLHIKAEINKQLDITKAKQPTRHYLKHHNHVPPWILLKNISLGTSINLFKCLNSKNKAEVANLLIPEQTISTKEKIEFISTAMEGIRKFRNYAAHSLNFVKCRTTYNIPGETLYQLLPKGTVRIYRKKICHKDKVAIKGIFGIILAMYIILADDLICSSMIHEFMSKLDSEHPILKPLYDNYIVVSDLPSDLMKRLQKLSLT